VSAASEALKRRLRAFALDTMSLIELLPKDIASRYGTARRNLRRQLERPPQRVG
jgi:hypothetical protein